MPIPFAKLHSSGNDFILIDERRRELVKRKADFAARVCDRNRSVGADGVLYLLPSKRADFRMRLLQPDRSEAEMCGNGLLCAAGWAHRSRPKSAYAIETLAGLERVEVRKRSGALWARADFGRAKFGRRDIPTRGRGEMVDEPLKGTGVRVTAVNTGVPHAVVFVGEVAKAPVAALGPKIRWHPSFPKGTNVNFVEAEGSTLNIRTFERGVEGETLSCGTGAVASLAAALRRHMLPGPRAKIVTRGGVNYAYERAGRYFLEGRPVLVCEGTLAG
jgi:diaminopimelate epimerase